MKVQILNSEGVILWERGEKGGISARGYVADGTQERIIAALKKALVQAEAELRLFNVGDRIADVAR